MGNSFAPTRTSLLFIYSLSAELQIDTLGPDIFEGQSREAGGGRGVVSEG